MSYAIDKEQVVAGYVNTHKTDTEFTVDDIYKYTSTSLWNAGVGPIRLNFTRMEMVRFLNKCVGHFLWRTANGWKIDKSLLNDTFTEEEKKHFDTDNKELARSFDLFCRLQVDMRTPDLLLDAMGFHFVYA